MRLLIAWSAWLLVLAATPVFAGGESSVASDNFDRASLGSDWAQLNPNWGNVVITSSDHFTGGSTSEEQSARWVGAGTFSDDQYSKFEVNGGLAFNGIFYRLGAICRASADTDGTRDYYGYEFQDDASGNPAARTLRLFKMVNGVKTELATPSTVSVGTGTSIKIECDGTTINGYVGGTLRHSATSQTDLTTGKPGILVQGGPAQSGDIWEGGDVTAAPPSSQSSLMLLHVGGGQ